MAEEKFTLASGFRSFYGHLVLLPENLTSLKLSLYFLLAELASWGEGGHRTVTEGQRSPAHMESSMPSRELKPHLRTAGACERAGPADPKLQDPHDTRQQRDI